MATNLALFWKNYSVAFSFSPRCCAYRICLLCRCHFVGLGVMAHGAEARNDKELNFPWCHPARYAQDESGKVSEEHDERGASKRVRGSGEGWGEKAREAWWTNWICPYGCNRSTRGIVTLDQSHRRQFFPNDWLDPVFVPLHGDVQLQMDELHQDMAEARAPGRMQMPIMQNHQKRKQYQNLLLHQRQHQHSHLFHQALLTWMGNNSLMRKKKKRIIPYIRS